MNKKGFTIIELVVSFSLTMVVVLVLFEIVLVLKDLFEVSGLKSELLNKQSLITQKLYEDINENNIYSIQQCGDYCLTFTFNDNTTKELEIDKENLTFKYGNLVVAFPQTTLFGNIIFETISTTSQSANSSIFRINVPISSSLVSDMTYNIDISMLYDSTQLTVGEIYIADNTDSCVEGVLCQNEIYDIGDSVLFGGYNWHIISNNDSNVTLLLDYNQMGNTMKHTINTDTSYKWSRSEIKQSINGDFLNAINTNKLSDKNTLINIVQVCDDETETNGYPGSISTNNICKTTYVNSMVRLLDNSEYVTLKQYLINNSVDTSWLYSNTIGSWMLSNGSGTENKILLVNSDGTTSFVSFDSVSIIRPVIIVTKK